MKTVSQPASEACPWYYSSASGFGAVLPSPSWQQVLYDTTSTKQFEDGPNRDWKLKIRRREDATTTFIGDKQTCEYSPGYHYSHFRDRVPTSSFVYMEEFESIASTPMGTFSHPPDPATIDVTSADNQAKMRFVKKANDVQRSFQGGVFLAELAETLHQIRHPAQALRKGLDDYLRALKKRRKGSLAARRRALAGTWLEYSFGWAPLVNDIRDGAKALAENFTYLSRASKRISASGESKLGLPLVSFDTHNGSGSIVSLLQRTGQIAQVRYIGAISSDAVSPQYMSAKNLGLTFSDLAPTIWEVIPWSFVVDYFTNVQEIIDGWALQSCQFSWKNRTQRLTSFDEYYSYRYLPPGPSGMDLDHYVFLPGHLKVSRTRHQRNSYGGDFIPTLRFEIPGMSTKWINLSALLAQGKRLQPF